MEINVEYSVGPTDKMSCIHIHFKRPKEEEVTDKICVSGRKRARTQVFNIDNACLNSNKKQNSVAKATF